MNLTDFKNILLLVIFTSLVMACTNVQERQEPENLLSEDKMVEIYTDMILLDAAERSNPRNFKTYELKTSEHIFNKFNIDSTTLSQNIAYYNLDFEANDDIYEKVRLNLAQRDEVIDSVSKVRDSLKKVEANKKKARIIDSIKPKTLIKQQAK